MPAPAEWPLSICLVLEDCLSLCKPSPQGEFSELERLTEPGPWLTQTLSCVLCVSLPHPPFRGLVTPSPLLNGLSSPPPNSSDLSPQSSGAATVALSPGLLCPLLPLTSTSVSLTSVSLTSVWFPPSFCFSTRLWPPSPGCPCDVFLLAALCPCRFAGVAHGAQLGNSLFQWQWPSCLPSKSAKGRNTKALINSTRLPNRCSRHSRFLAL